MNSNATHRISLLHPKLWKRHDSTDEKQRDAPILSRHFNASEGLSAAKSVKLVVLCNGPTAGISLNSMLLHSTPTSGAQAAPEVTMDSFEIKPLLLKRNLIEISLMSDKPGTADLSPTSHSPSGYPSTDRLIDIYLEVTS